MSINLSYPSSINSGATINVLPYEIGAQLGATWDDSKAILQLAGNYC
ncbi:MAG: hypothetical protein SAL70_09505 [Scytonema sp. PMC 1070.18]|nr:hypothetical protein [Scytonema sp. PMC 1070.18]